MFPASAQWHFFKCPAAHPREIACFTPAAEKASKTAVSLYAENVAVLIELLVSSFRYVDYDKLFSFIDVWFPPQ